MGPGLRRDDVEYEARLRPNTVIASAAKQSMVRQAERWIASSHPPSPEGGLRRTRVLLAMTARHTFAISPAHTPRVLLLIPALSELRAQGMPGARCARGLVCKM